jgi:hypothetical protein
MYSKSSPSLVQTVYTAEGARYLLIYLKSNSDSVFVIDDEGHVFVAPTELENIAEISKVIIEGKTSINESDNKLTIIFNSVITVNASLDPTLSAGTLLAESYHDLLASKRIIMDESKGASRTQEIPNVKYVYMETEKTRKKKVVKTSARSGMC